MEKNSLPINETGFRQPSGASPAAPGGPLALSARALPWPRSRPEAPPEAGVIARLRKSAFIRPFDGQAAGLVCNRFYRLILSNGCPFDCQYCYLRLTLGQNKGPVVFTNPWPEVERQLAKIPAGVFSTGDLADSLAVPPPLLKPALAYFRRQTAKFLFLTTKSTNLEVLRDVKPTPQVWISFSVNAIKTWELFEAQTPHPEARLAAAARLQAAGWRVRIRIDPIIPEVGLGHYREIARMVSDLAPERVTLGLLKHFPRRPQGRGAGPGRELAAAPGGLKRYPAPLKTRVFNTLAEWLGLQPAICRETPGLWAALGWQARGCNCTPHLNGSGSGPEPPAPRPGIFPAGH
jgi:spore photoproduct lyase